MALGGGTFTVQNKELPGAYINFVSAASANSALSERGIATMPLELDWGLDGEVFEVTETDFREDSRKIFGYGCKHEKLRGLRDLFLNARTLYAFRLNYGGAKASCAFAEARCSGIRGNDISIVIRVNADDSEAFDVITMLDGESADEQTVKSAAELKSNDFVNFKADAELEASAGVPLTGGTNGEIKGEAYQKYLEKIEPFTFNTMGVTVTDNATKSLFAAFVKRMRDEVGVKFQLVLHDYPKADCCGVISVKNSVLDGGAGELVYWVTGAAAGCAVNRSCQNKRYDGEYNVYADYTQTELKKALRAGEFVLHNVGGELRVLEDINTMVTFTDTQGEVFRDNQTVRVIDQIANDIAVIFNTKYLGAVPNDKAGRVSLWSDIVTHHRQLEQIRAIENFSDADVTVLPGETKKSVVVTDYITVVNAMSKLYMTVTVA